MHQHFRFSFRIFRKGGNEDGKNFRAFNVFKKPYSQTFPFMRTFDKSGNVRDDKRLIPAGYPDDTEHPATALAALGLAAPAPKDALLHLAAAFAKWYEAWRGEGFSALRAAWLSRAFGLGARIRVRLAEGDILGVFRDIDETGALVLGLPGGVTRTIAAGDVFFRG